MRAVPFCIYNVNYQIRKFGVWRVGLVGETERKKPVDRRKRREREREREMSRERERELNVFRK